MLASGMPDIEGSSTKYSRERELWAGLVLNCCRYLGPKTWTGLVRTYGSPAAALETGYRQWLEDSLATERQVRSLKKGEAYEKAEAVQERILRKGHRTLLWTDPEYPEILSHISTPPILLYYRGDPGILNKDCIAVVGSRKCSRYGLDMTKSICSELSAEGVSIVSGFASGIDREAHFAGLSGAGRSIAVLGTGIDLIYPAGNRDLWQEMEKSGLVLTEFSPGTEPEGHNFPHRNRIISGLSRGVLVTQGELQSGSMITASLALDQGREVFAVPGAVNMPGYEGCNQLIRDGAYLVRNARDILEVLECGVQPPAPETELSSGIDFSSLDLNEGERQIVDLIFRENEVHIDVLTRNTGLDSADISRIVTGLEIRGIVRRAPGMYYSLAL